MEMGEEAPSEAAKYKSKPHAAEAGGTDEDTLACSVCGFPMEPEWRVCPNCVTRYEAKCGTCGRTMQPWWLICPWCETRRPHEHGGT